MVRPHVPCAPLGESSLAAAFFLPKSVACFFLSSFFSLNVATRRAFGGAALVHSMFMTFSGFSLSGVPLAGDLLEWRSIETIPQRGIGWEADTPASDSLFADPLMKHLLGGKSSIRGTGSRPRQCSELRTMSARTLWTDHVGQCQKSGPREEGEIAVRLAAGEWTGENKLRSTCSTIYLSI